MIAGFIFLRLRGILGKKTGFEEDINSSFPHEAPAAKSKVDLNTNTFDDNAKKEFLKGAEIAYETIVTNFSKGKLKDIKSLLDINVYEQFNSAISERKSKKSNIEKANKILTNLKKRYKIVKDHLSPLGTQTKTSR